MNIYFWEYPYPRDFLRLSKRRKAWKDDVDARESVDDDDSLDNWEHFVGKASLYDDRALELVVARTLIRRGKRAYRSGISWQDFEAEEITIDSTSVARGESTLKKRRLAMSMALDDKTRLAVFDAMKVRLCHEIWLQEYPYLSSTQETKPSRCDSVMGEHDDRLEVPHRSKSHVPIEWTAADLQQDTDQELRVITPDWPWWRFQEDSACDPSCVQTPAQIACSHKAMKPSKR